MGKAFLASVVIVPVLLGMYAAKSRRLRRGLWQTLASVLAFAVLYVLLLYYLRVHWL
jgi:hypothetical protein